MPKLRVLLADDHAILRAGLRLLINRQSDMTVVAEAGNATDAVTKSAEHAPDVAVLDLSMPGGGGLYAIRALAASCPATHTLVLTMHDDQACAREALAAGASGYLTKSVADRELVTAIRAVHQGRLYVDATLGDLESAASSRGVAAPPSGSALSAREREVVTGIAMGHTHKEIAEQLGLSVKSVETYRARVSEKLSLRTRADLVRYATAAGLLRDR